MVDIATRLKPEMAMFVPEGRHEITTEGGLDVRAQEAKLREAVKRLAGEGIRVSVFIDAELPQVEAAARIGASVCEIHTGPYAHAFHAKGRDPESAPVVAELGYALPLVRDADTGDPIDPDARYHYAFDRGALRAPTAPLARGPMVRGATLLALAGGRYPDAETAAEAKRLMREVLDHYLEQRGVESRRVVQELQALDVRHEEENDHRD